MSLSRQELREGLAEILGKVFWSHMNGEDLDEPEMLAKYGPLALHLIDEYVEGVEDAVIKIANSPCECGKDHYGTPVRSVNGSVTTHCQFARVVPQRRRAGIGGDKNG